MSRAIVFPIDDGIPVCNELSSYVAHISKKELEDALTKSKAQKILVSNKLDLCPRCLEYVGTSSYIGRKECYCLNCGQKLIRGWQGGSR